MLGKTLHTDNHKNNFLVLGEGQADDMVALVQ